MKVITDTLADMRPIVTEETLIILMKSRNDGLTKGARQEG